MAKLQAPPRRPRTEAVSAPLVPRSDTPSVSDQPRRSIEPQRRHALICEAAYYRSEQRNFSPGQELEDWLAAEREIDRVLANEAPTQCDS